jgi:xylulokinase
LTQKKTALIGIDVGTTNVKAAAFDVNGMLLALTVHRLPVIRPHPNWEEYDPEEMFTYTARAVRDTLEKLKPCIRVAGVAVASMAETAVPIDNRGKALHNAVAWHDERSRPQADRLRQAIGAETIYRITGLPPAYIFGVNKLLWFKTHAPDAYRRTVCWLNVADYITYRLSGALATDYSLASRLMLLELKTGRWSADLLSACDIPATLFAELTPSGQKLGTVHAEGSAATGLPQGTVVVCGGHDHPCGALALGITEPGNVLDSMGTSESIFTVAKDARLDPQFAHTGYQQGFHVVPGKRYINGGLYTSGRCVEWIKDMLNEASYDDFITLAACAPPGSQGVFFLPHLRMANTPVDDPNSRGAFVGLSVGSSGASLARAVLEGVAYEAHRALTGLQELFGVTINRVRATGGGTRTQLLMQMKAALLGSAIDIFDMDEATALGAAMLAGIGAGVYADSDEAVAAVQLSATQITCDEHLHRYYQQAYGAVYRQLYEHLKPIHHQIARQVH